jgi:hypothetical protein
MANDTVQSSRDWLGSTRTNVVAWWIPQAAILAGLFVPLTVRTAVWIIALIWMRAVSSALTFALVETGLSQSVSNAY